MTEQEMNELLEQMPFEDYIITVASKFAPDEDWEIHNEILLAEISGYASGPTFVWNNDWYEGQPFVKIVGMIPVKAIITNSLFYFDTPLRLQHIFSTKYTMFIEAVREELKNGL